MVQVAAQDVLALGGVHDGCGIGVPREGLAFQLSHALPRQAELVSDRFERPGLALEAEAELQNPALTLGERIERPADTLLPKRFLGLVEGVDRLAVGEEVSELTLVVGADRLVQRDRRLRGAERLVDMLHRETGRLREL